MTKSEEGVEEVLQSFGFDKFMIGQVVQRLKQRGLIAEESFGDSYSKVFDILKDECAMDIDEVQIAMKSMLDVGVVFRER